MARPKKFEKGALITSISELHSEFEGNNTHVYWHGRLFHKAWLMSMQYRFIWQQVFQRQFRKAVVTKEWLRLYGPSEAA